MSGRRTSSLAPPVGPAAAVADDPLLGDLGDPAALLVHHLVLRRLALVVPPEGRILLRGLPFMTSAVGGGRGVPKKQMKG